jgi:hypothetical protein
VKVALLCLSLAAVALTSCTTLENRRDLYCGYGKVNGPYTRMLNGQININTRTVIVSTTKASSSEGKEVVK